MKEYLGLTVEDQMQKFIDVIENNAKNGWIVTSSNAYMLHNKVYYYALMERKLKEDKAPIIRAKSYF